MLSARSANQRVARELQRVVRGGGERVFLTLSRFHPSHRNARPFPTDARPAERARAGSRLVKPAELRRSRRGSRRDRIQRRRPTDFSRFRAVAVASRRRSCLLKDTVQSRPITRQTSLRGESVGSLSRGAEARRNCTRIASPHAVRQRLVFSRDDHARTRRLPPWSRYF